MVYGLRENRVIAVIHAFNELGLERQYHFRDLHLEVHDATIEIEQVPSYSDGCDSCVEGLLKFFP